MKRLFVVLFAFGASLLAYQHFWSKAAHAQSGGQQTSQILIPWITGSDAGYTSLLSVVNASMNPYGAAQQNGSCTVDAYYNGTHYGPAPLPTSFTNNTLPAGQLQVDTEAQIGSATGLSLANSGNRAYLYLTCNFSPVNAQVLFVNPGGVVTPFPGQTVDLSGPPQLLEPGRR